MSSSVSLIIPVYRSKTGIIKTTNIYDKYVNFDLVNAVIQGEVAGDATKVVGDATKVVGDATKVAFIMSTDFYLSNEIYCNSMKTKYIFLNKDEIFLNQRNDKTIICFSNIYELINSTKQKSFYILGNIEIVKCWFWLCNKIYISEIVDIDNETVGASNIEDDFQDNFFEFAYNFHISSYSESKVSNGIKTRLVCYEKQAKLGGVLEEYNYKTLVDKILKCGNYRTDRTGTGTLSLFGEQIRFNIRKSIPLLTTKRVAWKSCIEELLWFLRGDTDVTKLQSKGVSIWDGNTSREFLDANGFKKYPEHDLRYGYGHQIRRFGAKYSSKNGGVDQLMYIEKLLKEDPFSRRIMWNLWNAKDVQEMVLTPCHVNFQLYVKEINGVKYLSGHLYQRSVDVFLGFPFNIFSYSVLIYILAARCDMVPDTLVISTGDTHIYSNHLDQIKQQLGRQARPPPCLKLSTSVATKRYEDLTIDDFELIGYFPHQALKAPLAV
jgi:thymidylate synthase